MTIALLVFGLTLGALATLAIVLHRVRTARSACIGDYAFPQGVRARVHRR